MFENVKWQFIFCLDLGFILQVYPIRGLKNESQIKRDSKVKEIQKEELIMDNKIITTGTMKKAGAALVACVVALGGLGWYGYQQKITEFHNVAQANSKIVEVKLAENNIEVIDEAQLKSNVAQAMGVSESDISWKEIFLCEGFGGQFMARGNHFMSRGGHYDGHRGPNGNGYGHGPHHNGWQNDNDKDDHYNDHWGPGNGGRHHGNWQGMPPTPEQMKEFKEKGQEQPPVQPPQLPDQKQDNKDNKDNKDMKPAFQFHPVYNVICQANNVNYMAHVDAVSGKVLHCMAMGNRMFPQR